MAKRIKLTAPECCPVMALVVTRCNGSGRRVGITREMMLSFKTPTNRPRKGMNEHGKRTS